MREAFAKAGLAAAPLEAVTYASLANPTPRPMRSALDNTTFAGLGIAALPSWQDALDAFLAVRAVRLAAAP